MTYKVYEQKEIVELFEKAFENIKTNEMSCIPSFNRALKVIQRCIETSSATPLREHVNKGEPSVALFAISWALSTISGSFEEKMRYEYSLSGIAKYTNEYLEREDIAPTIKSIGAFINLFKFKQDFEKDSFDIPYLVQKLYLTDYKLFIQLPHRSNSEPDMLCYYRSIEDLARNKKTTIKPGKWFLANNLGIEKQALEFSQAWSASAIKPPKVFFLSELVDKGGLSEDNWEWVYKKTDGRTGSCMIKCPEIARVYADNPVLDMAYITSTDKPFEGTVLARTIIRHDKKNYIRTYQADHKLGGYFTGFLREKGFTENRDLKGVTIKRLISKENPKHLIMPYLDGNSQIVMGNKENPNVFTVLSQLNSSSNKESRYLEVYNGTSAGRVQLRTRCAHCGAMGDAYDAGFIKGKDDKPLRVDSCIYCRKNFVFCTKTRKSYSLSDYKFYWQLGRDGSGLVVDFSKPTDQDQRKITCDFTKNNVKSTFIPSDLEDKDGNRLKDSTSILVENAPYATTPVLTVDGKISEENYCSTVPEDVYACLTSEMKKKIGKHFSKYDAEMRDSFGTFDKKAKRKKKFLTILNKRGYITNEELESMVDSVKIPKLEVELFDNESKMIREYNEDDGEIEYVFNLSSSIREKLWKPILSETEKLKKELDDLLASWNAVEVVMVNN